MTRLTAYVRRGGCVRATTCVRQWPSRLVYGGARCQAARVSAEVGSVWIGVLEHLDRTPAIRSSELA